MIKLFHIKIHVKKTKVDALFNSGLQPYLIAKGFISNFGLEVCDHNYPYQLVWVNKDAKMQCKINFFVSVDYFDEVEVDVPLDAYGVVIVSPYMHLRDAIFIRRENQYCLIKDGKPFHQCT